MSTYKTALEDISNLDTNIRVAIVVGNFNAHYTHQLEKLNREFFAEK